MADAVVLHPSDDVAVLVARAPAGADPLGLCPLPQALNAGHKIARHAIPAGRAIRKLGQIIGYATEAIPPGAHVHTHNCAMGDHDRAVTIGADLPAARAAVAEPGKPIFFNGFHRQDGTVGTRNFIALIATVNCSATVIRKAAEAVERSGMLDAHPTVDGIVALSHGTGCGMAAEGPGWEALRRTLWGHATHPNVGAAVFVGLGCEVMEIARMRAMFGDGAPTRFHGLTIQDEGGTLATIARIVAKVRDILPEVARATRAPAPLSALKVGLQCGGSDGLSAITANPALGVASDLLVAQGGTAVLSETPEIFGAETLLLRRAVSDAVGRKLLDRIGWWEDYTAKNGGSMDNNPSPGNKAGGLTTILEKSLGAAAKGGQAPLSDVLGYGERLTTPGFVFMDTPGYDPVSVTGQIAGGCQVIVFTTGRGSAFGSKPAPTIKIATNDALYAKMQGDMDLNAGDVASRGTPLATKGQEILQAIVATASGTRTKSELLGLGDHEFLPWQIGAVM